MKEKREKINLVEKLSICLDMSVSGSAPSHIKPAYIIINSKDISPDENEYITIFLCPENNNHKISKISMK